MANLKSNPDRTPSVEDTPRDHEAMAVWAAAKGSGGPGIMRTSRLSPIAWHAWVGKSPVAASLLRVMSMYISTQRCVSATPLRATSPGG